MVRLLLLALTAMVVVGVGYILIPSNVLRPDVHLTVSAAKPVNPDAFVVHTAPTPTAPLPPVPSTSQAAIAAAAAAAQVTPPDAPPPSSLDALMQRLRAGADAGSAASGVPGASPAAPPAAPPPGPTPATVAPAPPPEQPAPPPASRWTSVTGQGTRWRMTPRGSGYTVAIDLGGGRVAQVHVASAFTALDSAGMNQRVDYLKQTILQNFPPESAAYTFARDGSVSLDN